MSSIGSPFFSLDRVGVERSGTWVLRGVTADLPAGQVTGLVGPSGSGKTSLLRLLNRLDEASEGIIMVNGMEISSIPVRELRRGVGFVFQEPALFPGSVAENLRWAFEVAEVEVTDEEARIQEALEDAELPPSFLSRPVRDLSGGEAQRVTLARALLLRPEALLLDEPTSALDPETARRVVETIQEMSVRRGITVVLSTHRIEEARVAAETVLVLDEGRVVRSGPPEEVLSFPTGSGPG